MKRILYARILLLIMVLQVASTVPSFALTGGPSQPEFQSFEPVTTTEMVNLPDGGFTYNIPLMDIGGYPLNLSYHADITADMEASCVGLGWSINPGVINRNIRALPDDFNGEADQIKKEYNLKPNTTFGASLAVSYEIYGLDALKGINSALSIGMNMGVFYNNYWGIGYEFGISPGISSGNKGSGSLTAGIGTSINSQSGANFSPSLRYSAKMEEKNQQSHYGIAASASTTINSRDGLKAVNLSADISRNIKDKRKVDKEEDENYGSAGSGASASFDYAGNTFTPEFTMPQTNVSATVNVKPMGIELFGSNGAPNISGYFSKQYLRNKTEVKSAYGMLYAQNGYPDENALMDFNREKDGAFKDYTTHLPIVNPGYDVLSVNGQGIGGSFQLERGDVSIFFDAKSTAEGHGGSLGLELGTGNTAHGGVDLKYNYTKSVSKKWNSDILNNYKFSGTGDEGYEPAYYKAAGEMAIESDPAYYQHLGEDLAVRADLETQLPQQKPFDVGTTPFLKDEKGGFHGGQAVQRVKRERRNQVISYLSAAEADVVGLEQKIMSYPLNQFVNAAPTMINRTDGNVVRKDHHLSQIESTQPDGMRYVYGIPAYNLTQKEVSFSVAATTSSMNCTKGVVSYAPGIDNKNINTRGQDNYFNSVETPAYAHTYLLTSVLGKDYEDLSGDGPTADDLGSYTKINYSKVRDNQAATDVSHWRVPFGMSTANHNAGFYSKTHDDKGTYIYGQKEIWEVHSIESKTMVAEFTYEDRLDGFGVKDENGGRASYNLNKKLVKITLYTKPDRLKHGANATPIKTVHFTYNYSLCPGTENSIAPGGEKLTLTSVYFTFGYSEKGRLSDYQFSYKNQNYGYGGKDYDRWGNYKPNVVNSNCLNPVEGNPLSNDEFPYAEQNKATADANAGTWSLNQIELPSGGTIKVDYEAKHYAFVQDKPAMQLMKITGIKSIGGKKLYGIPYSIFDDHLKVYFSLKDPNISGGELKRDYLKGIGPDGDYLYLKCYVKMNAGALLSSKWEYVSLYSQITDYGVESGHGYVILRTLPSTDKLNPKDLNPITKYALQYMRENLPEIAYDQTPVDENSMVLGVSTFKPLAAMGSQLVQFVHGFNNVMIARGYCREIALDRSFIRLYEPNGMKYGGGCRVAKIEIADNWGKMTNDPTANFSYGQIYDYTTTEMRSDGSVATISSGVASYEPLIGGDENPWRMPEVITEDRKFAIDNIHYVEQPFGEVFMPSPQVSYGKITVRNLQYSKVQRTATGHTEMHYYTARDFPVKTRRTDLQKMPRKVNPLLGLLKIKLKEHMNASQGYLIETNNMHGQAKSSEVFDENGTKISGVKYHYKTKSTGELDNEVQVIQPGGAVETGLLGVNYSLAGDVRQSKSETTSGGIALNLDGYLASVVPVIVPLPWPNFEQSEERFQSVSFTKLVNKFGVLERVEAYDLGSNISTENLAYDAETGEALLTKTYNEFNDPIYNLKLPAHWAYAGMRGAYKNIGFEIKNCNIVNGVCNLSSSSAAANFFMPGDEVLLNGATKAWVLHVQAANNRIYLIDIKGAPIPSDADASIKIIRSGMRNMPGAQIGTITSMNNPINNGFLELNQQAKILHAEAIEYGDKWQTFCQQNPELCFGNNQINPFVRNVLGEWRPVKSWLHLAERNRSPIAGTTSTTNIRDNGQYTTFSSFWTRPANNTPLSLWSKTETNWTWSALATQINPNGTELESKNRLEQYSAEILGYYDQLITGVASNSRYRQMAFEGFEDFGYNAAVANSVFGCSIPRHFGEGFGPYTSNQTFHSGKYALELRGTSVSTQYAIEENCPPTLSRATTTNPVFGPYLIDRCNCIQSFSPDPGKYVVTAWVKEGNGLGKRFYNQHQLIIRSNNSATPSIFTAKGMIIDGWQRIEGEFVINPGDTYINVELKALGGNTVYFDDLRIFPFNGSMKNYVYDDISLKLLAELDDNGYAKFYEYSQEGELIRIKQETKSGIVTIKESRSSQPK